MTTPDREPDRPSPGDGDMTSASGTPVPVKIGGDRRDRRIFAVLLAGPVVWFTHFMLVYLVAEMGCTGDGPGFELFDPPVPVITTIAATVVAVGLCAASATWGLRWWTSSRRRPDAADDVDDSRSAELDGEQRGGSIAFVGFTLSVFSILAVLFTAAPALAQLSC